MVLPIQLIMLAELFREDCPLYVVGGAVRNRLLGVEYDDYDICSRASIDEVKSYIHGTVFEIVCEYPRTGTIVIKTGDIKFEYTRFRTDSYANGVGSHAPCEVIFTDDIMLDAKRRDFTCNSIYYDIRQGEIIDPLGGVADIERRLIKCGRDSCEVLGEDALRIMRMVRQSMELGFSIDSECLVSAKEYAEQLTNIATERIREEFDKILVADGRYGGISERHLPSDGIKLLVDIGAMQYIMPEILDMIGCEQNPKYHINDVFYHTLSAVDYAPKHLRLPALLHDIAKPKLKREVGNMYGHEITGKLMAVDMLKRLKYSNVEIDRVSTLVEIHMFNVDNLTKSSKCRRFIAKYYDYIDDYLALRYADGMATNRENYDDSSVKRLVDIRSKMFSKNMPLSVADMPISGSDLINCGYHGKEIGEKLKELWLQMLDCDIVHTREELLKRIVKK